MVSVNGLNISDNVSYITEEVTFRSMPTRNIETQDISRMPGLKILNSEWTSKEIEIKGYVFGTSASGLRGLVDNLQQNFAVKSLALMVDSDRTYTATMETLEIPNQFYNNTYVPYTAKFLAADPFAYASQITASGTVISGTLTYSGTITISGTVFASPLLYLYPTGAPAGDSGIKQLQVGYTPKGETVTISGTINYTSAVSIDYGNFQVTNSGIASDFTGIFSRWEPGVTNFTITVASGVRQGYNWVFAYQPRYYE